MSRHPGERFPTRNVRATGPRRSDAAELSTLADDIAQRGASSQASMRTIYELTAGDLQSTVSGWAAGNDQWNAEDIVVATYSQLWRRAAERPADLPVADWLTSLALAQILLMRRAAAG